jgi:hypothetical protein
MEVVVELFRASVDAPLLKARPVAVAIGSGRHGIAVALGVEVFLTGGHFERLRHRLIANVQAMTVLIGSPHAVTERHVAIGRPDLALLRQPAVASTLEVDARRPRAAAQEPEGAATAACVGRA